MAYLMNRDDPEQINEQQKKSNSQPQNTSPGAYGGTATGGAAAGAASAPSSGAAPTSNNGTGFINAQQFLNANQGAAQQLGQSMAGMVSGEGQAAQGAIQGVQNTFNAGLGKGTQGAKGTNQYQDLSNTPGYDNASGLAQTATQDAQGLTSGQGRGGLLASYYGDTAGSGANAWDSFYAGAGNGNAGLFLNTQQQVGNQTQALDNANAASANAAPTYTPKPAAAPTPSQYGPGVGVVRTGGYDNPNRGNPRPRGRVNYG